MRIMWINLLLGVWLLVAPFVLALEVLTDVPIGNEVLVGFVLIGTSAWILATEPVAGARWLQIVSGLWLMTSPFVISERTVPALVGNDLIVGCMAVVVAFLQPRASVSPRPSPQ
jgi:hypothetical protein